MKRKLALLVIAVVILAGAAGYAALYYYTHRFDELILAQARAQELDPRLVKSLIYEESFFNPSAKSQAGAKGLMQITPIVITEWAQVKGYPDEQTAIAKEFGAQMRARNIAADQLLYDPEVNMRLGCWYLRFLLNKYEAQPLQLPMALAGYNAGPSKAEQWVRTDREGTASRAPSVDEFLNRIDYRETREYVRRILIRYDAYKQANAGL